MAEFPGSGGRPDLVAVGIGDANWLIIARLDPFWRENGTGLEAGSWHIVCHALRNVSSPRGDMPIVLSGRGLVF
jgi:hypothetical protein